MKIQLVFVFLVFLLKHKVAYASNCPTQGYSEPNVYLQGLALESFKVNTVFECYRKCEENILCASINMNLTDNTCELKSSTKTRHPGKTDSQQNTIYMEIREDNSAPGSSPDEPITSCKTLKEDDSQAKSGVYWMKFNEPSSAPFQVFCDMITDGGGWTLVWSYTLTQYSSFTSWSNAVTPIPNWPLERSVGVWVPQSTTIPLSESSRSAMDFALWRKIGNEILVKPNISNWIACAEGTGSFVNWRTGNLTCRIVKAKTPTCTTVVPNNILVDSYCGPGFLAGEKHIFHFEGRTDDCYPIHDPCGYTTSGVSNHLTNVSDPGSVLYVR